MPWKRCAICKADFDVLSDVCPNHTGHVLQLIPQPVVEAPPMSTPVPPDEEIVVDGAPIEIVQEAPVEVSPSKDEVVSAGWVVSEAPEGSEVVEEVKPDGQE